MKIKKPEWWEEWTYFDSKTLSLKIKDEAPDDVKKEWKKINDKFYD